MEETTEKVAKPIQRISALDEAVKQIGLEHLREYLQNQEKEDWIDDGDTIKKSEESQLRKDVVKNWSLNKEGVLPTEHPLFNVTADALGISKNEAFQNQHELTAIIDMAVNFLGTSSPDVLFKFLTQQLRRTNGKSYRAIKSRLRTLIEETEL